MTTRTCYCDRDFTVEEVKDLVKTVKGKEIIWEGLTESCLIQDKSFESLTRELNLMFRKYGINQCIQKITFLAQVNAETGFFSLSHEEKSKYKSSQSVYKGRGIIQLTGNQSSDGFYNNPGPYEEYGKSLGNENKFKNNPDLIATELHYTIDSSGWEWSVFKKSLPYTASYSETAKNEGRDWIKANFPKGLNKSLNQIALAIEEAGEEKYFWFQSKILNGYTITHKDNVDPNGWKDRKEGFEKLKSWFKYNKDICNGDKELEFINTENMPPWMVIAWEEYNKYKDYYEKDSPLKEQILKYFVKTRNSDLTHTAAWCAAFVHWCFYNTTEYKNTNTKGAAGARDWGPENNPYLGGGKDGWLKGEKCELFYGAVVVFKTFSHVAFIVGYNSKTDKYVYLGGNQGGGNSGEQKISLGAASKSTFLYIMKPIGYIISDEEKKLPENPETAINNHNSTR